ncbi:hypothetical protein N9908_04950 [Akkermansiaceae bacterium]|nr:hypothetical protein [Akkermansiaceae bacterium]
MNTSKALQMAILVVVLLFVSLYLGIGAATAQGEVLVWVGLGVGIATLLILGNRVWLLVPAVMLSSLSFRWIPGNLSLMEVASLSFVGYSSFLVLARRLTFKVRFDGIHLGVFLMLILVAQVYLRNPVGLSITGSANVGARPYASFGLAMAVCLFLSWLVVPVAEIKKARNYMVAGGVISVIFELIARIPGMGFPMAIAFGTSNMSFAEGPATDVLDEGQATRNDAGAAMGKSLSAILVSYVSPLKALFKAVWLPILVISIAGGLISGFRSKLLVVLLTYAFGVYYWNGFKGVFIASLIGICGVIAVAIINMVHPLPPNVQRSLSFLPGTWEQRYLDDTEASSDWRFEMWEEVLFTDNWIKNKTLGDGLGFTKEEHELQESLAQSSYKGGPGIQGWDSQRASILVNGDYHSGPVSMVRVMGYVGMVIFTLSIIALAVAAHRYIKKMRYSPYFGIVCIFCIPIVWHPLFYLFIYGGFKGDAPQFLLSVGLLTLLRRNLPLPGQEEDESLESEMEPAN